MIPAAATALTWFKAFKPQCLYLAGACLLVGSCVGATGGWKVASWKAAKEIGALELKIEKAATAQAEYEAGQAKREIEIRDQVRVKYEPTKQATEALAADIRDLARGVRLCGQQTKVEFSSPTPGIIETRPGEQPRAAESVLVELAQHIAKRCDEQGNQLNALIDWVTADRQ